MNQEIQSLVEVSDELTSAPLSRYGELLARRRVIVDTLAAREGPPYGAEELAPALRSGNDARSRLLVEIGTLRAKIDELRRLYTGLGQLRPTHATPASLDVRL